MNWPAILADGAIVASNVGSVIRLGDIALQADGRNSRSHRFAHHCGERGTFVGSHDQQIGFLEDKGFDLRDLLTVVLLSVGDGQLDIGFLGTDLGHQFILRGSDRVPRYCIG